MMVASLDLLKPSLQFSNNSFGIGATRTVAGSEALGSAMIKRICSQRLVGVLGTFKFAVDLIAGYFGVLHAHLSQVSHD